MLSVERVDREPSVLVVVLWLASLLVLHFALGHMPWVWERWFAWWGGPSDASGPWAACPYPFCGKWMP
jgi:hypothetical protein